MSRVRLKIHRGLRQTCTNWEEKPKLCAGIPDPHQSCPLESTARWQPALLDGEDPLRWKPIQWSSCRILALFGDQPQQSLCQLRHRPIILQLLRNWTGNEILVNATNIQSLWLQKRQSVWRIPSIAWHGGKCTKEIQIININQRGLHRGSLKHHINPKLTRKVGLSNKLFIEIAFKISKQSWDLLWPRQIAFENEESCLRNWILQ